MTPPAYDEQIESLERQFVAECVQNPQDEEAWKRFNDYFGFYIMLWIHRAMPWKPVQEREDVFQSLMLKIYADRVLERIDPGHPSQRAFLRRVTKNFVIDYQRREQVQSVSIKRDEWLADAISMLADGFPPKSEEELLQAIIDHLAERKLDERHMAIYEAFLDLTPASEVASRFGVSVATAYRYRSRGWSGTNGPIRKGLQKWETRQNGRHHANRNGPELHRAVPARFDQGARI
jgi:RNA polymerase sigma factor (sigma-70 family)